MTTISNVRVGILDSAPHREMAGARETAPETMLFLLARDLRSLPSSLCDPGSGGQIQSWARIPAATSRLWGSR